MFSLIASRALISTLEMRVGDTIDIHTDAGIQSDVGPIAIDFEAGDLTLHPENFNFHCCRFQIGLLYDTVPNRAS